MKIVLFTLSRMGFLGAPHGKGGGGQKSPPFSKICHACATMMKLGTVIHYPKEIEKIYQSSDTLPEFC